MNLQFYLEKLHSSKEFKDFMKKNPDTYLCSGFFVIDKEGSDNKQHFDYYVPKQKKMFSFKLSSEKEDKEGIKIIPIELFDNKIPKKISKNNFDFKDIEKMIQDEMENQKIKNKVQKIMFSLQNINESDFLICTIFISMLGILRVNVDISSNKITQFEKKSFFDIVKVKKKNN